MRKNIVIIIVFTLLFSALILFINNRHARPKGLIAFVIDDWGYNKKNIELLFQIQRPITVSILPNLRYSSYIAKAVGDKKTMHDIILHLPLESESDEAAEINTIRGDMEKSEIMSIFEKDIESVPGLIGVSNHQGSNATRDKRVMRVIFEELKRRRLFFLDSLTTSDSVARDVAREAGVGFCQRDVFLDITDQTDFENFYSYIKGQIDELSMIAINNGSAIGIGHDRTITLNAIKDSIPELEKKGIKIVPLKDLVRKDE